jgi:glycosyltransferase involved in cell wall biosynthesis
LPVTDIPQLTIIYADEGDLQKIKEINYPYIDFIKLASELSLFKKGINFLYRKTTGVNFYNLNKKMSPKYLDAIFPVPLYFNTQIAKKALYWIPDFQHAHLSKLFSTTELAERNFLYTKISLAKGNIILSSYDVQKDFNALYPNSKIKQVIIQFAVTHPLYETIDYSALVKKYDLPDEYFFCPNQFWIHKNQKIILEAVALLKSKQNKNIHVVFSGKNYDPRNSNYLDELKKYIKENNIENNISFLGFIDRKEQLLIMKKSIAVIQPSLFEGWSTVVEDTKAMNQNIIVSDIPVHKEQLEEQGTYFDPLDSNSLASILFNFKKKSIAFDYKKNKLTFATSFIHLLND